MRSMIAVLTIVGICGIYAPGDAHAQVCLHGGTLPSLDCSTGSVCCVAGALNPDAPAPATRLLCEEALLWNWRNVGDQCTPASLANHQDSFNVEVDPDEDRPYPSRVCDPNTEFARHYSSAYLLGAIKYEPGKTWHRPMEYRRAGGAWENDYHPTLTHHFAIDREGDTPNASNGDGLITFYCPLYNGDQSGTPVYRASDYVHEAWHSSDYGHHDWGNKKDWYYPYWKGAVEDGQLDQRFTPSYMPTGAPDKGGCRFGPCPPQGMVSVYQVHFEYLCDLATSPADWVPRMLVAQASQTASMLRDSKYTDGGVFLNHEPIGVDCAAAPKIWRNPWVPSADKELQVDLHFNAFMFEWDPFPNENDSDTFDTTGVLKVSPSQRTDSLEIRSQVVDGEVWVKLEANAELLADNETVKVRYNVRFYERSGNNLDDCDIDLNDCNCPGGFREIVLGPEDSCLADGPPCWRPAPVLSNYHMSNECTGEVDAKDYADVDLEFSLNWN
jgi:hypothetical protein